MESMEQNTTFLVTEYEILSLVLGNLNASDLRRASMVCTDWNNAANIIKRRHVSLGWDIVKNTLFKEPRSVQDFFVRRVVSLLDTKIYNKAELVLAFVNTRVNTVLKEALTRLRYSYNTFIPVGVMGIVGTTSELRRYSEMEDADAFSYLMLPKMDHVQIKTFDLLESESVDLPDDVKCLIIIPDPDQKKNLEVCQRYCSYFHHRYDGKIVIAGGIPFLMEGPYVKNSEPAFHSTAIAFSGPCVSAHTIMIPENVRTVSDAEQFIVKLKEEVTSTTNSFCLMFSCIARGARWYKKRNVESTLFQKHFPNTPLVGMFCNGELGTEATGPPPQKKAGQAFVHGYTTILLFVSLGPSRIPKTGS